MGKKSNAKKKMRKMVEEKAKEEEKKKFSKKKSKKELKKEIKKSDKKPQKKIKGKKVTEKPKKEEPKKQEAKKEKKKRKISRKKIFGGVLALIMLFLLFAVGYLLFQQAFRPTPIAKYLPAENTIAAIEINTNFNHNQITKTFNLLKDYPEYSKEKLIESVENKFLMNFEGEIEPWLGRQIGIAITNSKNREETLNTYYFAEVYSKTNARKYVTSKASESTYSGYEFYVSPANKGYTFIDDYLVYSQDSEAIKELIDFQNTNETAVNEASSFTRINNNLPLNKIVYLYINFDQINENFLQTVPLLSEKGLTFEAIKPLFNVFDAEGMAIIALDDKFAVQSFISLDSEIVEESEYINFKEKYSANLAEYVSADALAFWGGENLEYQLKRLLEILAKGERGTITLFDKLLKNYTLQYFGPEISFENDILPLFKNEFALVIEQSEEKNIFKLIIELEDPKSDVVKLHEIADNFVEISAVFEPKVVEHVLEDGTMTREIVAVPEEIVKKQSKYQGETIYEMEMGKQDWGIYYSTLDNTAVISTHLEGVKSAIDSKNQKIPSLKSSDIYTNLIQPVLKSSDEVTYFNTEKLFPILFEQEEIPPFLSPISSISSGKNYFNDGIISINYLRIK